MLLLKDTKTFLPFQSLKNIVQILDCLKWPKKIEEFCCYGDASIVELIEQFMSLLEWNSYKIESITAE